jgi:hypothetical protein
VNPAKKFFTQALVVSLLAWACAARAEQKLQDKDCLACHSDSTLTMDAHGKQVSLYVDGS